MSVSVQEEPYSICWAKNRNRLKLHSTSIQQSAGSAAHFKWTFPNSNLGTTNHHVVFSIDGFLLVYTISTADNEYSATSRSTLTLKMQRNYYIKQLFTVERTANTIELTAIAVGHHVAEIYWTDTEGVRTTTLTPDIYEEGSDKKDKPNYAVVAKVQAVINNYNELVTRECDGMVYNPNGNGDIFIDLAVLKDFIPQPDIPATGGSAFQLLTNALMKYRVSYGETWGDGSPRIQNWNTTPANNGYYYAICGEEVERYAALNLPDWKSGQNYGIIDRNDLFWLIGEDTGMTVKVRRSQCEYIYGLFYDHLNSMGTAASGSKRITVAMTGKKRDGGAVSISNTYSQNNGQIYRIDVSPSRFDVEVTHYSVTVSTNGGSWSRNYVVMPDFYRQTQFLLQNKYGLLKSIVSGELRKEVQTEADVVKMDGRRYLDFTEKGDVYTAMLNMLSQAEARRIGQCVCNEYHYIKANGKWVRITIEPGSFTIRDDENGLVSVEFSFRFVEDQQENLSDGDTSRFADLIIDDWNMSVVARDIVTEPVTNNLL